MTKISQFIKEGRKESKTTVLRDCQKEWARKEKANETPAAAVAFSALFAGCIRVASQGEKWDGLNGRKKSCRKAEKVHG